MDIKITGEIPREVTEFLLHELSSLGDFAASSSQYIKSGGKRIRPVLVIRSCELCGGTKEQAFSVACAVELLHNFTLVHDDIIDKDETRHGVPTVHEQFGQDHAILTGNVLHAKAFELIARGADKEIVKDVISILASTSISVNQGEMEDVEFAKEHVLPEIEEYMAMIKKKTASLIQASCQLGAVCARADKAHVEALGSFGYYTGIAFQITDDVIGLVGNPENTQKPVGNDLREGKKTLPILHALHYGKDHPDFGKKMREVFGNKDSSKEDIDSMVERIKETDIEEQTRQIAREYIAKAKKAIASYPSVPAKESLEKLADFIAERAQ